MDLDGIGANNWLDQMEGPKAFTNQTNTRIAIANKDSETGLRIKWNRRLERDSLGMELDRIFDEDGEPIS